MPRDAGARAGAAAATFRATPARPALAVAEIRLVRPLDLLPATKYV